MVDEERCNVRPSVHSWIVGPSRGLLAIFAMFASSTPDQGCSITFLSEESKIGSLMIGMSILSANRFSPTVIRASQ